MARKDISDSLVLKADLTKDRTFPYQTLSDWTGGCEKVCYRAMERAYERGLIEYGTSLRSGWVTDKGMDLLNMEEK